MSITGKITNLFADKAMTIPAFPRTKIKAVSDDNGVGLDAILNGMVHAEEYSPDVVTVPLNADTFSGHPVDDFVKHEDLPLGIEHGGTGATNVEDARKNLGAMSMELLWENASPDSDFAAQTISVNGEKCTHFVIDFNLLANSTNGFSSVVFPGKTNLCCNAATYQGKAGGYIHRRDVTVSADKKSLSFSNGYRQLGETEETNKANVAIPMAIYGFKGVTA